MSDNQTKMTEIHLRVLVAKDGDIWIAQCLEYDICAQAPDPETLKLRFATTIQAEAE